LQISAGLVLGHSVEKSDLGGMLVIVGRMLGIGKFITSPMESVSAGSRRLLKLGGILSMAVVAIFVY
jgi:hypothetical protein